MPPSTADETIASAFGLLSLADNEPLADVAMTGVEIDVSIKDIAYSAQLRYQFRNNGTDPLEAKYLFPVFSGATVCGFKACIDGRVVDGRVMESGQAQQVYDDAISQGHGAYKLDKTQADAFEMVVGNLPPSCECEITVTVVGMTETGHGPPGTSVFRLPTTVAPRYTPQPSQIDAHADTTVDCPGKGKASKKRKSPPVQYHSRRGEERYLMRLSVNVETKSNVARLACTSHADAAEVEFRGHAARLTLEGALLDRDFVMSYLCDDVDKPRIWIEVPKLSGTLLASQATSQATAGEETKEAVMVCMQPDLGTDSSQLPGEYVFILDRSGSMHGQSIVHARNAVAEALLSLHSSSTFNVVSFGSDMELMFKKPKKATPAAVKDAVDKLRQMEADLGGTEIMKPLEYALKLRRPSGALGQRQRQVFFMTDGSVWNQDACFALVAKHSRNNRVFSFGIGPCASSSLIKGIAKAGRGTATFVNSTDMSAVVQKVRMSMEPCIVAESLEWSHQGMPEPLDVELDPVPIFRGQRLVLFFFAPFDPAVSRKPRHRSPPATGRKTRGLSSLPSLATTCNVRLCLLDHARNPLPPSLMAGVAEMSSEGGHKTNIISRLAALDRVASLADRSLVSSDAGVKQRCTEEITKLGVQYQIATDHTSFVAVEERDLSSRSDPTRLQKQNVPNTLPTGSHYPPAGGGRWAGSKHNSMAKKVQNSTGKQAQKQPEPISYGVASASSICGAVGDFQRAFLGPTNDVDRQANDCWLDAALGVLMQIVPLQEELIHLASDSWELMQVNGGHGHVSLCFGAALGGVMLTWQRLLRTSAGSSRRALDSAKRRLWEADQLPALGFIHGCTYSLEAVLCRILWRLARDGVGSARKVRVISDVGRQTADTLFSAGEWQWMLVVGSQVSGVIQSLKATRRRPARLVAFASAEHISLLPHQEDEARNDHDDEDDDKYAWHYTVWSPDECGGYWVYDDLMGLIDEESRHFGCQGGYVSPSAWFAAQTLDTASDSAAAVLLTRASK